MRLDARTAHLLSTVGLPDTEWFMAKASLRADDHVDIPRWYRTRGTVPRECRDWLVLGMLAATALGLDPNSGTVYALGDGPTHMTYRPPPSRCRIPRLRSHRVRGPAACPGRERRGPRRAR
ncbi:SUKH-4 family immunity protein [Streptomyces termitum]|uniref:SUKH-4 family immunity protein n=1 Tax=Streptomyces termitum TaxID=67368 RepID=UPI0033BC140C